jgi:O-antigen/teichoic acid export membrane protein
MALILGSGIGNFVAVALSPVVTRLFDPASFGSFTLLVAIAMVMTPLMSLRLELAVPLAEEDSAGYALAHAGVAASVALGISCSTLLYLAEPSIGRLVGQESTGTFLWVAPLLSSTMSTFAVLNSLAIRHARYVAIARRNVVMAVTTLGCQILSGILGYGLGGLLVGFAMGQVIGTISLLHGSGLQSAPARLGRRRTNIRHAVSRYRRVPLVLAPAGVVNSLGLQVPIVLLAHNYSPDVVGWFGLTQRVLAVPVTLFGLSVAQVYLSEVAQVSRDGSGQALQHFWKASRGLFWLGALAAITLIAAGPTLFEFMFGQEWRVSGDFARALAVALAAQLIASPLSQTLIIFERSGLQLAWDIFRVLAVAATLSLAAKLDFSATNAVWALGGALTLTYAMSWGLSRHTIIAATDLSETAGGGTSPNAQ